MWDELFDWLVALLPTKVVVGCLVVFVFAVGFVLLWYHFG